MLYLFVSFAKLFVGRDYSRKRKESVWAAFLNLLNRPDGFIQNMTSRYCRVVNLMKIADVIDGDWWTMNLIVRLMSFTQGRGEDGVLVS